MDDEEDWDIISIEDIAGEFQIPFLAELIERNEKLSVNMEHASGWIEEDGERFHIMPVVEFHPLEEQEGFQLVVHHAHLDDDSNARASFYTFRKSDEEPGYRVTLDENSHIFEEIRVIDEGEWNEELPVYPPTGSLGDPFKELAVEPGTE